MNKPSEFIRGHGSRHDSELDEFINLLSAEAAKSGRERSLEHLLNTANLTMQQVKLLGSSPVITGSGASLLALQRYATTKAFAESRASEEPWSNWKWISHYLGSLLPF